MVPSTSGSGGEFARALTETLGTVPTGAVMAVGWIALAALVVIAAGRGPGLLLAALGAGALLGVVTVHVLDTLAYEQGRAGLIARYGLAGPLEGLTLAGVLALVAGPALAVVVRGSRRVRATR